MSVGTYGGSIVAIDNFISTNGKYRILVAPDPDSDPWPDGIRVGSGVSAMALLKDVPIWYELWRKVNGFPPDFYRANESGTSEKEMMKQQLLAILFCTSAVFGQDSLQTLSHEELLTWWQNIIPSPLLHCWCWIRQMPVS